MLLAKQLYVLNETPYIFSIKQFHDLNYTVPMAFTRSSKVSRSTRAPFFTRAL